MRYKPSIDISIGGRRRRKQSVDIGGGIVKKEIQTVCRHCYWGRRGEEIQIMVIRKYEAT